MKILVAEDTEDSRIMLEMALASQGYEVMSGTNGIEALHLARTTPPDLIISDILMPEMDGFELCRQVKADPELKKIPFIFYTATYVERQDEELALALGATRFVIKPLEPQALMAIIREELNAYQAEDASVSHESSKEESKLEEMHLHTVGRKLDKKVKELEQEREALKKSEEKYRHLVESVQDYYFFYTQDTKGVFTYLSPSIEFVLGYKPEEFLLHYSEYLTDNPVNKEVTRHSELSIKGEEQPPYEIEIYHKDGSLHWLEVKETPVFNQQGNVLHIEGIAHDITERKQAEEALRRAQKMEAIGQLAGGIAHDFNNILAVILGNLELLNRQMATGDKSHKQVNSIQKAAKRAANLTKQLLSFSSPQAKQVSITDINRLIGEMENLISRSVTPEVVVELKLIDDLWLTEIDPGDFEDALLNLSINARDAIAGHGHLTIKTRNTTLDATYCAKNPATTPGEYVELAVSDSGEGISPELREHIFDPFYTTKDQGKGTGLGLSMVYGFVKRSGGFINVYSEPGRGTTFQLYLPRANGEEGPIGLSSGLDEALPMGHETILAVDDEPELLELARESLEELGYRVLTAIDGQQALEYLEHEPSIDLLFTDVIMPGVINGYQLAKQATAIRPDLKLLLTSGYTGKETDRQDHENYKDLFLKKPYSLTELTSKIREVIDRSDNK